MTEVSEVNYDRTRFSFDLMSKIDAYNDGERHSGKGDLSQGEALHDCLKYIMSNERCILQIAKDMEVKDQEILELKAKLYDYQNRH